MHPPLACVGHPVFEHQPLEPFGGSGAPPDLEAQRSGGALLLPGSRAQEVRRHLPLMLEALRALRRGGGPAAAVAARTATVLAAPSVRADVERVLAAGAATTRARPRDGSSSRLSAQLRRELRSSRRSFRGRPA